MSLHIGVVIRFGPRGFGFIAESGTGLQWFFHVNDVAGRRELRAGEKVRFQDGGGIPGRAPKAVCVELVADASWTDGLNLYGRRKAPVAEPQQERGRQ